MAFVTDSNRPPTALATPSNRLPNRFWGHLRGPCPSKCISAITPAALQALTPKELSMLAGALAKAPSAPNHALFNKLARHIVRSGAIDSFGAQSIANTAWAYASVGLNEVPLLVGLADRTRAGGVLPDFRPQHTANTAWAYARLGHRDPLLMDALTARTLQPGYLGTFKAVDVANVVWAYARLGLRHEPLLAGLAQRARDPAVLRRAKAQEVANIAWGFARLGVRDPPLMRALAARARDPRCLPQFVPQTVATTLWAFAKLRVPCNPLLEAITRHTTQAGLLPAFGPQVSVHRSIALAQPHFLRTLTGPDISAPTATPLPCLPAFSLRSDCPYAPPPVLTQSVWSGRAMYPPPCQRRCPFALRSPPPLAQTASFCPLRQPVAVPVGHPYISHESS